MTRRPRCEPITVDVDGEQVTVYARHAGGITDEDRKAVEEFARALRVQTPPLTRDEGCLYAGPECRAGCCQDIHPANRPPEGEMSDS